MWCNTGLWEKCRTQCHQTHSKRIVRVLTVMILSHVVGLECILAAQRPTVPAGPLGVSWMYMLTGGERWRGREQDSGWGGTGSPLISHNPLLYFGPTQKLSLEQIHTFPTVVFQDSHPPNLSLFPPPPCFSFCFSPPSLIPLS